MTKQKYELHVCNYESKQWELCIWAEEAWINPSGSRVIGGNVRQVETGQEYNVSFIISRQTVTKLERQEHLKERRTARIWQACECTAFDNLKNLVKNKDNRWNISPDKLLLT